jgi:hypothetical protein
MAVGLGMDKLVEEAWDLYLKIFELKYLNLVDRNRLCLMANRALLRYERRKYK